MTKKTDKRNYRLGIVNGIFMRLSSSEIDGNTLLPAFIDNITSSRVLVGCTSTLSTLGQVLPQLVVANLVEDQPRKKPLYVATAWIRVLSLAVLSALIFGIGAAHRNLMLAGFFILYSIHTLGSGVSNIPFYDIVGKITPAAKRSRFFSARYLLGGIGGALAGQFIVRPVLAHHSFPVNYGILFSISAFFFLLAVVSFCLIKEPIHPVREQKRTFSEYLRSGFALLKTDRNYRTLILMDTAEGFCAISFPFYVIFARNVLGIPEAMVGTFIAAQMVGMIVSNLAWQKLSDRGGSLIVLRAYALLALATPAVALIAERFRITSPLFFTVLFLVRGAKISAQGISRLSYLFDIAPAIERPAYVAFMPFFTLPVVFLPPVGGMIINLTSFGFLFGFSFLCGLVLVALSLRLK